MTYCSEIGDPAVEPAGQSTARGEVGVGVLEPTAVPAALIAHALVESTPNCPSYVPV